jgi:hypothetical protein
LSRWLAVPLVALLLAAWQSALLHPLKHVDGGGRYVHVAGVHSTDSDGPGAGGNPSDQLCDALAALGSCAGSAPAAAVVAPLVGAPCFRLHAAPRAAEAPAYFSQAPPQLS